MSKANIYYAWWIDDKEKGTNLTGSQTIFWLDIGKTKNPRIVIDAGAIQWVKKALELNRSIKKEVLDADFLIITHAHSDHAGMVPYLYKRGFSGRIIMTELTKLQSKEMWLDYVRLTENEIEKVSEINAKIAQKLKNAFSVKTLYETVVQPESYLKTLKQEIEEIRNRNRKVKDYYTKHLKIKTAIETLQEITTKLKSKPTQEEKEKLTQDKERIELSLEKMVKNKDPKTLYNEALKVLAEKNIANEDDIKALLEVVPKIERNQKNKSEAENKIANITGNINYEIAYQESIAILKEFWVETESDISAVLKEVPVLLFNADDVDMVYAKIETLELKQELELQNFHPISQWNDKSIEKLPEMVKNGYNKPIPVASYLKGTVTAKLQWLIKKITKETQENDIIAKNNEELSTQIKLALDFVNWYEENGQSIADFERQYASLLQEDEDEIENEIDKLSSFYLNAQNYTLDELVKKFQSIDFPLPSYEEYIRLDAELAEELNIQTEQDIDKHLPNIPDRDYENRDIKSALKNAVYLKANENIFDELLFIESVIWLDFEKLISFLKEWKKVYMKDFAYQELLALIRTWIAESVKNKKRNNDITDFLHKAYDLVEIYEWNRELYLANNQKDYQKAKKLAQSYKRTFIKESIYTKDELDYALNVEYTWISKEKRIVHIKRLDDARLYDILFNKNFDVVYYFEPKIRERVKERLSQEITKIEIEKASQSEKHESYLSAVQFIRMYEGHEKINITPEQYAEAKKTLEKHTIQSRKDIENFNIFDDSFQYWEKEIDELFKNIQIVEKNFAKAEIQRIHITSADDERIYDLPYSYEDPKVVYFIDEWLKEAIKKKLLEWMWDFYRTSTIRKKKRKELLEKFQLNQKYHEHARFLINIEGYESGNDLKNEVLSRSAQVRSLREKLWSIRRARKLQAKLTEGGEQKEADYKEAKALLEKYQIQNISDIGKVLQVQSYIPYWVSDIKRTIELLKSIHIDKNQDLLESIKLNFFDAWHIEWSVQAVLTLVVSEVDNILNGKTEIYTWGKRRLKHVNYWFSWDLWRIKDPNLAGTPAKIPYKLDYYQCESTYADRIHLDKQIAINRLFWAIDSAQWKILIPAFSMQRTQELLMTILERRLEAQKFIEQIKELSKEKKSTEAQLTLISPTATDREVLEEKEILENEIFNLESRINYIQPLIFDYDIVLDSPLSEKITQIYIDNCGEKYNLLDKNVQLQLFGKEIITYVKKTGEWAILEDQENRITLEELYSPERRDKKEIVFSASGMCDGWAILPHLKEILQNPTSKIVAVWYAPESTRLWKIKMHDEFISIDGEVYELKCEIEDITGFSGHMDEEEILMHLTQMEFNKWAIIALTHGDEKRLSLAKKVQAAMDEIGKKVQVIIPKLLDTTTLKI